MKNIALVSCECFPLVKVGGLADVVGSLLTKLPRYVNVKLFLPAFSQITSKYDYETLGTFDVFFSNSRVEKASLLKLKNTFNNVYLIENQAYFNRSQLYGESGLDYPDNLERFSFFSKAVLEACKVFNIDVDVFHCNDWQTALVPLYLKVFYGQLQSSTVFTIHNLAYQGIFPGNFFWKLGLGGEFFSMQQLEFYGNINIMKAGIIHSNKINTVSPTYAREILTPEFGCKLDGLLKTREKDISGILNGIDYSIWNPRFDGLIFKKYHSRKTKVVNKKYLQSLFSLPEDNVAVFGFVGRLVEQKGIDIIIDTIERMLNRKFQVVFLGTGELRYEDGVVALTKKYPDRINARIGFDEKLAHQIYAGSDFFLMPSRFEPCGLGQMIALKYGTIPVVRKTGGLADTVMPVDTTKNSGWGFVFENPLPVELESSMRDAIDLYSDEKLMDDIFKRAVSLDFSWNKSILEYVSLYEKAMGKI
ncbi:MAG TPA: glycogen synthase GlgA [bacterium]|nr:glycogen synthase GlgA [bacterium]